jgi:hypothetical protein
MAHPLASIRVWILDARRSDPGVAIWSSLAFLLFAAACGTSGGGGANPDGGTGAAAGSTVAGGSAGAAGAGSGAAATTGGGSPIPTAQLQITPPDGTTAWTGADIELSLYDPAGIVADAWLDQVKAKAFLETWPERAPVAFQAETLAEAPPNYKVVHLIPAAPLDGRWYVAGVNSGLPSAIRFYTPLEDGTNGVRFRGDSHPIVRDVQFCLKAGIGMKLLVDFSEPLTLGVAPEKLVALTVGGTSAPCTSYDQRPDALYFTCDALSPTAKVNVSVTAEAASATGAPLQSGSWSIDIAALANGSCRVFSPPF